MKLWNDYVLWFRCLGGQPNSSMYFTPINSKPRNLTQNYAFQDPALKQQNYEKGTAMFKFDLIAKSCMHTRVVPLALIKFHTW